MNRQKAIDIIEGLFPVDSQYLDTNAIGERLLAQAKRDCENWRNLPDAILFRYAELCEQEEERAMYKLTLYESREFGSCYRWSGPTPATGTDTPPTPLAG